MAAIVHSIARHIAHNGPVVNSITNDIGRRGIDAHRAYQTSSHRHGHHNHDENPFTPVAITTLVFTGIVFFIAILMAQYTYGYLLPTLAMVETPTALLVESTTTEDKEDSLDKEPLIEQREITLVQQAPITTSIRRTVRHLRSVGGCLAAYRGASFFAVNVLLLSQLSVIFSFIPFDIGNIVAATILSTIRMGWTHVVISSPSPLPWFRRIPSIKTFKAIAPITALSALCEELAVLLPIALAMTLGLNADLTRLNESKDVHNQTCVMKMILVAAVCISWVILVVVPVTTVLSRMHASLLPEGEGTILTVHRQGAMTIKEAWKSVDWNARMRIYKTYVKGFVVQTSISLLFAAIVYAELTIFLGPRFPEVMTQLMLMY